MSRTVIREHKNYLFLFLYLCCVIYITLLSRNPSIARIIKLDLLSSYRMWFTGNAARGRSIVQNITLFVPLGYFLMAVLLPRAGKERFLIAMAIGFAFSLMVETVQYFSGRGMFDADDLFNNTLGVAVGSGTYFLVSHVFGKVRFGQLICGVLSVLMIAAGIIGCFWMSEIVRGDFIEIVELDFEKDRIPLPEIGNDSSFSVSEMDLKAYSKKYDTYVFQKDNKLIWLIGYEIEPTTEIIYHIHTDELEKLPEHRKQYGFDNRGFRPGGENELDSVAHYRVFEKKIPEEYRVTSVVVGFNPGDGVVWSQGFRVKQDLQT